MARNVVVHTAAPGPVAFAASVAAAAGDDLGLVLTAIEFHHEKVSGGRIEEERGWAGRTFNTFDEPIFIGSAVAQLAGHADAVVVDGIDDWAARLLKRFPDQPIELDAEVSSLVSVMQARMADLILVVRRDAPKEPAVQSLLARLIETIEQRADDVIELKSGAAPRALKGRVPKG